MNEKEFEELFGNTPFENIKKIQHYIDKNYIPVQKVKDKIEKLKEKIENLPAEVYPIIEDDLQIKIEVLQQLLEKE